VHRYRKTTGCARDIPWQPLLRTLWVSCADDRLKEMLNGTGWEWWDNRRISEDVWRTQKSDGFHFEDPIADREAHHNTWPTERQNTVAQHVAHREAELASGREAPGMLEIQFAQSLLHRLFRDELQSILDERSAQPLHLRARADCRITSLGCGCSNT
jgi:hypothetical protein